MAMSYPYSSFYLEAQWSKRKVAEHFHSGGESQATPLQFLPDIIQWEISGGCNRIL